ncbi:hypothetical protein [Paludifilum halophilum]|uniref:hypothetical protein n=1 Tax=Paludifilum halophilum TaxID=1642702 RepID=UPI0011406C9A|nr:hypothetical protein [Paludifilum halophilum]
MKKQIMSVALSVIATSMAFLPLQVSAQDNVKEIALSDQKGQPEVRQGEYVLLHNKGKAFVSDAINNKIPGSLKIKEQNGHKTDLVGVGLYKKNGRVHTDFFLTNKSEMSFDVLEQRAQKKSAQRSQTVSAMEDTPSYTDGFEWSFYDEETGELSGTMTSDVEYYRQGTATDADGKKVSVWDVKYFNTVRPTYAGYFWQTRELITRSSVEGRSGEQIKSYGPQTTPDGADAQVSLTGLVPTFAWTFKTYDSKIQDTSDLTVDYGRWISDITLGTDVSKYTYVTQPGVRVTNSTGNIYFDHSHRVYFYKNLSADNYGYTGVITRNWPDL